MDKHNIADKLTELSNSVKQTDSFSVAKSGVRFVFLLNVDLCT